MAPHSVAPQIKKLLESGGDEKFFTDGPIELRIIAKKQPTDTQAYYITMKLLMNGADIGYRNFPVTIKQIKTKQGNTSEQLVMNPGCFSIASQYRQKGVGEYLFSLQNALLASYSNAIGIIFPSPYNLAGKDTYENLLPILRNYYKKFGFIESPTNDKHMIILFKNWKMDSRRAFFKAIYENDEKTFKEQEIVKILIAKGALNDPKMASKARNMAIEVNDKDILKLIDKAIARLKITEVVKE